jgi:PAS domain S-box-containing protein
MKGDDELSKLDRMLHFVDRSMSEALQTEKSMLENATNLICSLDQDCFFTRVNPCASRVFRVPIEELIGASMLDFVLEEDREMAGLKLRNTRDHLDKTTFDLRLKQPGGAVIETRWSVLWSENQKSLFCVVQDVTEQKQVERLKQDFLHMISDDLRSPLTAMLSSATTIEEAALSERAKRDMQRGRRALERLIALVDDLLDLQQLQSGEITFESADFDLQSVLGEAADLLKDSATAKNVSVELPQGQWLVRGDQKKVMQAALNLLSNAIKFSPAEGHVAVTVQQLENFFEVSITDSGPGVPPKFHDRIFEAFEQVPNKRSKEGTGLGLAICKSIIDAHGGEVGLRAPEGTTGSTFWFSLPKPQ